MGKIYDLLDQGLAEVPADSEETQHYIIAKKLLLCEVRIGPEASFAGAGGEDRFENNLLATPLKLSPWLLFCFGIFSDFLEFFLQFFLEKCLRILFFWVLCAFGSTPLGPGTG
jgi:hypothetical protein